MKFYTNSTENKKNIRIKIFTRKKYPIDNWPLTEKKILTQ